MIGVDIDVISMVSSQLNFTFDLSFETVYGGCEGDEGWESDDKGEDCVWTGLEGAVNRSDALFGVGHVVILDVASFQLSS